MNKNINKFEPINVFIKDPKLFADVVLAIDRPLFIKEANKIRRKFKINTPLRDGNYQHWVLTNLNNKEIQNYGKAITDLRMFLGYDSNYEKVFELGILGCDIYENDFITADLFYVKQVRSYLSSAPTTIMAITVTPQTRKKDLLKTFKCYRDIIKDWQSKPDSYVTRDEPQDTKTEIKRDRDWYWQKIAGKTYRQIAQGADTKEIDFYTSYKYKIREAIKSYRLRLEI